jgi:hypothetical protein
MYFLNALRDWSASLNGNKDKSLAGATATGMLSD